MTDRHAGKTVQHQAQRQRTPTGDNLRQVHLAPIETLRGVVQRSKISRPLAAGEIGENNMTRVIDMASLPRGTELHFVNGVFRQL